MSEAVVSHTWSDWGTSGGTVASGDTLVQWQIPSMAERHVREVVTQMRASLAAGGDVADAVAIASGFEASPHILGVHHSGDITVVDDTDTVAANDAVSAVKTVTSLAARERRVVVVAGAVSFDGDSDYDNLGGFGAFMVRMNVDQVFAVGPGARALFLSVGMEGSWDGESRHCASVEPAYDEVRAFVRPGDVVLVLGSTGESLLPIVEGLVGTPS